ncbi:hypothetical protein [Actinacidiphila sp. ITFR-21]|uniref:hypothetical protein n=1 Tax=Actinacidiphila sp. ITFR-21 TaxID=3075199 RepID=UPI0028897F97|nr:hypothetical protein [Streptomyces sp. ITFR-21]WNI19148.1 hypothetical protein RLT57_28835 [Streptomyces sp. ITFR-21]
MSGINRPAAGRYPLHPGRPLVFRCRRRGVWGFTCDCLDQASTPRFGTEYPNRVSWADAMRKAESHVRFGHKSPAQLETERLELLFAQPARSRS